MFIRLGSAAGWCRPYINYDYNVGHGLDRMFGTGDWYAINEIRNVSIPCSRDRRCGASSKSVSGR